MEKALLFTSQVIERVIQELICDFEKMNSVPIKHAVLFGSCARGDWNQESDMDIAVLLDVPINEIRKYDDAFCLEGVKVEMKYVSALVNFLSVSYEDFEKNKKWNPLYQNILKEGKVIYTRA